MTAVIHKYIISKAKRQIIHMPAGAQILSAQGQHETGVLWAIVDPDAPEEPRTFVCLNTGVPMKGGLSYIDTVQIHDGYTVFHVFEEIMQ